MATCRTIWRFTWRAAGLLACVLIVAIPVRCQQEAELARKHRILAFRKRLQLPDNAQVVGFSEEHEGIDQRLTIKLPPTRKPDAWVTYLGNQLEIPKEERDGPHEWVAEYCGVTYDPVAGTYEARIF